MKDIRIFVASSKELLPERNALAYFVLAHEDEFAKRGLRVRLSKWEYVDPKMTAGRTEDRYLDEMYNCDAAMVIFKDKAGKYTREELDKALAREAAGSDRIKTHKILFSADGKPDSDAAKLRASLPADSYGIYENSEGLQKEFLALVDHLVEMDQSGTSGKKLLEAAPDAHVRRITAFLAADEELMADRNAFADTVLNLNDLLAFRNIRVQLRFCGAGLPKEKMEELVASSEMGLVLYGTNIRAFGHEEMDSAYNRTCRGENPKKLYVFFRDEEGNDLSPEFKEFRDSFVDKLGHFVCQFGGPDSLRLAFLLSLLRYAGETVEVYSTVTPPTASVFVGRDAELRQLTDLLTVTPTFPAGRLPIVTGAGGTGKSELVRQYASQLRVQYPGGVFQVDMETRRTWNDVFLGMLAVKCNGGGNNGVDIFECLGLKKEEAEKTTGADVRNALLKRARDCGPVLLVLDNLEHCEELVGENAFAEAFPAGFSERVSVNVVATARTCDTPLSKNDWAQVFPLGDLSPESALELLFANKRAESEDEVRAARRVAELLGYRALFLRRVPMILNGVNKKSRIVCRNYTTLARVLEEDPLLTISRTATVDETHLSSRLWELVRNNLSEWGLGEACIKLIEIASFFSPDGFPQHILRHLWKELVFPELEDWGTEEEVFDQVVDLAKNYNIFQSTDPVRIHRLDRAAILVTAKEKHCIEESIVRALSRYPYVTHREWVSLAGHDEIVQFIPQGLMNGSLCVSLLRKSHVFAEICPWWKLSNHEWITLLQFNPEYAQHCPWDRMLKYDDENVYEHERILRISDEISTTEWCELLAAQPVFADRCPWNRLYGKDWAWLLGERPEFADRCDWSKLSDVNFANLMCKKVEFEDKCDFEGWSGDAWAVLISARPEFAERCPWDRISGDAWADILVACPQYFVKCKWEDLSGSAWSKLLCSRPEFADKCDWGSLSGWNWARLLERRPCFAEKCDWSKFRQPESNDVMVWTILLSAQPQFINRCPVDRIFLIDDPFECEDAMTLLEKCPDLYEVLPWCKLDGVLLGMILALHPEFADRCPLENLSGGDWVSLLYAQPQFAEKCEWQKLEGSDWCSLLTDQPQFSKWCDWQKLGVTDWSSLLEVQPQFAKFK